MDISQQFLTTLSIQMRLSRHRYHRLRRLISQATICLNMRERLIQMACNHQHQIIQKLQRKCRGLLYGMRQTGGISIVTTKYNPKTSNHSALRIMFYGIYGTCQNNSMWTQRRFQKLLWTRRSPQPTPEASFYTWRARCLEFLLCYLIGGITSLSLSGVISGRPIYLIQQ